MQSRNEFIYSFRFLFLSGGKAMDESGDDLLNIRPERIHQKSPCFLGSPEDMDELKKYLTGLQN